MELGVQTLLQIHKNKLPSTKEALETHIESGEQFALRRVAYATSSIKVRGGLMTKSAIERCANLGAKARQMPAVQRAIAEALNGSENSPFFVPGMKAETAEVLAA